MVYGFFFLIYFLGKRICFFFFERDIFSKVSEVSGCWGFFWIFNIGTIYKVAFVSGRTVLE